LNQSFLLFKGGAMAEQGNIEKRAYVRAELTTRVKIQPVSRKEFAHYEAMGPGGMPGDVSEAERRLSNSELGYLTDRLNQIEEKLDRVLKKLCPDSNLGETISYGTAKNVSGAGISLILEDAFEEGQIVLLSISVPGVSVGLLHAFGEVVRVVSKKDKNRRAYETSVKFLAIAEDEREALISYAFRRQRQAIRDLTLAKERDQDLPSNEG
jgi:c-di-GMP-binding flagellar brake protein YcgR